MPKFRVNIQPYEFLSNDEGKVVIRQRFVKKIPQEIVLSRGQMLMFIDNLKWFLERWDAEDRRAEVEDLLNEIKR